MDITLARTFLEIVDCGNFVRAAERLHVTQTAVSVRVQSLESQLGRKLFIRNKSGATLTAAGEQFLRYAPLLLQVWERARHQVAVPPGLHAVVAVGAELSLWSPFMLDWLVWMHRSTPQLALRTQVGLSAGLMDQVSDGILDIAVLYAPQHRLGLKVELLMKEKLVLVTTAKGKAAPADGDYVYVDWGPDFATQHNLSYPERSNP
jgi:DNA-binding transcriptional LysR family regulator